MTDNISDFKNLVGKKSIVIPIIQRDYAQGRNNGRVITNRTGFVNDLFKTFETAGEEMNLHFVYGINKTGDEFLPIDGQQRLTSVFLFSWIIAVLEKKTDVFIDNTNGFSYQVRDSAKRFFRHLTETEKDKVGALRLKYLADFEEFADGIKDLNKASWFKMNWNGDPTVMGALVFLRHVRDEYKKRKNKISGSITDRIFSDDCPIKLVYVSQNEIDPDEYENLSEKEREDRAFDAENKAGVTYINMNARGKILNDFENLKALLYNDNRKFVEDYNSRYINTFLAVVNSYKEKATLFEKAEEMDRLAVGLMVNLYKDLKMFEGKMKIFEEEDEEKKSKKQAGDNRDYYKILERLRGRNKDDKYPDDEKYPEDYIKFLEETLKDPIEPGLIKTFTSYSTERRKRNPVRYAFFYSFWEKYRKLDKDDGWSLLKKHLGLDAYSWSNFDTALLKRMMDVVRENKVLIGMAVKMCGGDYRSIGCRDYLSAISYSDISGEYEKITSTKSGRDYSVDFPREFFKEEIIKAKLVAEYTSRLNLLETFSSQYEKYRIGFLLYICGYWDRFEDGSFDELSKYIKEFGSIGGASCDWSMSHEWKKLYYLSFLTKDGNGNYQLPAAGISTSWDSSRLIFDGIETVPAENKNVFDRIKNILDERLGDPLLLQNAIASVKPESWLYYVLNRDYDELYVNDVKLESGIYTKSGYPLRENFYEFVYMKDLEHKKNIKGYRDYFKKRLSGNPADQDFVFSVSATDPADANVSKKLRVKYFRNLNVSAQGYIISEEPGALVFARFKEIDPAGDVIFETDSDPLLIGREQTNCVNKAAVVKTAIERITAGEWGKIGFDQACDVKALIKGYLGDVNDEYTVFYDYYNGVITISEDIPVSPAVCPQAASDMKLV